ncbi:MAG: PQQ-binding-like beta-propeller repeat protein, partial [Candidatus Omnitrophica bacterium]|nr:PQQ-binding-like beta-propeller repeat protein [Candidatus Omnitrophota bacterium]
TETGEDLWKKKTENWASSGMRVPPIPDEKNIYFGYDDGVLYALDKKTGEEKWQYDVGGTIYARPLLLEGNLYFGTSAGKIYSVDTQTGEKIWETMIHPDIFFLNFLHEEGKIALLWCDSPPDERQERTAVSFSVLDVETGEMKWTTTWETQEVMSWPIAAFNTLFITIGKELRALDFDTGQTKWNFMSKNAFYPKLSIKENFLLASEGKYFYAKADTSSSVYVINCETGERNWEYEAAGGIEKGTTSSGYLITVSSQHVTAAGIEKSTVSFVDESTGEEQGSIVIKEGEIVDQPVVSDGNLFYITTKDQKGNSYIYKLKWKD